MAVILGIDPGSRITGYAVIKSNGQKHQYVTSGCIMIKPGTLAERLEQIYKHITSIVETYQPQESAIEQVFISQNANAALKLGQARGAAICAMAMGGLAVAEYSARLVKQTVVGYGGADKSQIQQMVKLLLNLSGVPQVDAADALAVAICHAHHLTSPLIAKKHQIVSAGT